MAVRKSIGYCPECDAKITLKNHNLRLGQTVVCRGCDTRLEVVELDPLELDWAFDDADDDYLDFGDDLFFDDEYDAQHDNGSNR